MVLHNSRTRIIHGVAEVMDSHSSQLTVRAMAGLANWLSIGVWLCSALTLFESSMVLGHLLLSQPLYMLSLCEHAIQSVAQFLLDSAQCEKQHVVRMNVFQYRYAIFCIRWSTPSFSLIPFSLIPLCLIPFHLIPLCLLSFCLIPFGLISFCLIPSSLLANCKS